MWGVTLSISCPGELTVKYCGLEDSVALKKGDKVKRGDVVGKVGAIPIESALEAHIHIQTIIDDKSVNPVDVLNLL